MLGSFEGTAVELGETVDGAEVMVILGIAEGAAVGGSEGLPVLTKVGTAVGRLVENFVGGF
jgi:hypothetical protein